LPIAVGVNQLADLFGYFNAGDQTQFDKNAIGRKRNLSDLQILIEDMRRHGEVKGARAQQTEQQSFHRFSFYHFVRRAP
jgi:hypothetical protein